MKYILLPIVALLFACPVISQEDPRFEGIDAEMETILATHQVPGFSVAVVEGDSLLFAKGYGFRDYDKRLPATENTIYAIGSCTKAFTCALIGQLAAENRLQLTDHPAKHLPGLTFYNAELNSQLHLTDLMRHSTGLPRHDFAWYLFPSADTDSLIQKLEFQEPFAGIREQWYYNNFMFLLQGAIAEAITDSTWEANIQARFLEPLGMQTASTNLKDWKAGAEPALGYRLTDDKEIKRMDYYDISAMGPAGSINASVREMANWVRAWINGGMFEGKEIIPGVFRTPATSSQMIVRGGLPNDKHPDVHFATYGFGWFQASYKGHYRVEHGGNIDGFSANTSFYPSDSIGIIVLTNQNGSPIPSIVRNTLADRMLSLERTDWNAEVKAQIEEAEAQQQSADSTRYANRVENTRPSHAAVEYTGTYRHPGYGEFQIVAKGDSLFAYFRNDSLYLKHYHYDVFEPIAIEDGQIDTSISLPQEMFANFKTGVSGDIAYADMKFEPTLAPIEFSRTPATIELSVAELERYVGEYNLGPQTAKIYRKDDAALYLFLAGQPEYELLPTGKDQFVIKTLQGYSLNFETTDSGEVSGVAFIQPNGTFRAVRK